jgi:Helix-turn-helix domain
VSPLDVKRQIETEGAGRYNGAAVQRERIAHRLRQGPATRGELARVCCCPSPTKRVSELRRGGLPIRTEWIEETAPDGSVNPTALYSLAVDADPAQLSLTFE